MNTFLKDSDKSTSECYAYLAPKGFEALLSKELKGITTVHGRLMVASPKRAFWSQNIWYNQIVVPIQSISHAANTLRAIERNWWPYAFKYFRRTKLIQEKLPYVSAKPLDFLAPIPSAPLGSWMLIDDHTMLYASDCMSPMPNGEWHFNEDKVSPPSRAYLKLWEFFTRFNVYPQKHETVLDLGASPGGWTWVLAKLANCVIAYDRSPLDAKIMALNNVIFKARDAFKVKLADHPEISWVFSDVICFPEKLFDFVSGLLALFPNLNYVITIKFQGSDHGDVVSRFAALPGDLVHLSHNKHELTWFHLHH